MVMLRPRRDCSSSSRITGAALLSWIATATCFLNHNPELTFTPPSSIDGRLAVDPAEHEFTLRHVFHRGATLHPKLHRRLDVEAGVAAYDKHAVKAGAWADADIGPFAARSNGLEIERLSDRRIDRILGMEMHARKGGYRPILPESDWTVDEVVGPNITDQQTVLNLARMAACAYNQGPDDPEWMDVGQGFNRSLDYGWQGDGLRGHVFADKTNSTIVLSIKGTSKAVFDGAETTTNDKLNDNLFFGCCCGQGGSAMLKPACGCMTDTLTCNNTCVREELKQENRYWRASIDLYENVTALYPNTSNIWLIGHSLGGSVAALLGLTVGQAAVTFEAPGEALAAQRLGLPNPPRMGAHAPPQKRQLTGAFHFGHNADPAFTGTCNGAAASCVLGGYAMETQCHTGMVCEYDVQGDLGWHNFMTNHGIHVCISGVYEYYDKPAKCIPDYDCDGDCFKWKYFESNGSEITTTRTLTSTTSASFTRTETCQTPGWWGCLDESTTASFTTTMTTTLTTESCASYGWFGRCLDSVTTTETLTTTFAGVQPPVTTTATTTTTSPTSEATETQTETQTCKNRGWFGRCLDDGKESKTSLASTSTPAAVASPAITVGPYAQNELR